MASLKGFSEEDLLAAQECAKMCRVIVANIPAALSKDITKTIQINRELEKKGFSELKEDRHD